MYYATFETAAGWIGAIASARGLSRTTLPKKSRDLAESSLNPYKGKTIYSTDYFKDLANKFRAYFHGHIVNFRERLDFSDATQFERAVWETTQKIPYGETRSYGWVAVQIGKPLGHRPVGHALGRNPLPIIIPCHRVIGSDGKLHGFGGGLEMKEFLLKLETTS
jgi:methylated-DNA-[protein]-cysteine S-methyltransferase